MIGFCVLLLTCLGVTPGPGWSDPILVTDSANTHRRIQFINRDSQDRFHLVWAGYNDQHRIAYKMFLLDGTTVYPETMISRNTNSAYLSEMVMGDSLNVFWREYSPIYNAIRSLEDGSEITPATYLFTTSTNYPYIRSSPDSLGRLHVLYNIGYDVYYASWIPAPGSGFITEYEWKVEGAHAGGVLLVDGNRVHIVVQDPVYHTYEYLQYDLEGNTVIPLTDFTEDDITCGRFPELNLDANGNLMIIHMIARSSQQYRYVLWKVDKVTGATLVDEKIIVIGIPPEMDVSPSFILRRLPGTDQFYLCWTDGYWRKKIFNLIMDDDGNVLVDWHIAYDYSDEDPEQVEAIDGVVDETGNLYIIYNQGETEPVLGGYPTFGWFNHDSLGIEGDVYTEPPVVSLKSSHNPSCGSVQFFLEGADSMELRVFDITGRMVAGVSLYDGRGFWNSTGSAGERLPTGVYTVVGDQGVSLRITLLAE
ncbi:hypothetical protein DRQ25_10125 [Candidatus Fermentibacteria bacterium]|nr:MAG: hypothetical protein DRQ25_10125 [Candidatus Fermentibacteria bacterium]